MAQCRFTNLCFLSVLVFFWLAILPVAPALSQDFGSQQPPPAPTNLMTLNLGKQFVLMWNEVPTPNVTHYRIFRYDNSDKEKNVSMIAEVPKNKIVSKHQYVDKTAIPGHSYTYFITSKNVFGMQSVNSMLVAGVRGY